MGLIGFFCLEQAVLVFRNDAASEIEADLLFFQEVGDLEFLLFDRSGLTAEKGDNFVDLSKNVGIEKKQKGKEGHNK